MDGVRHPKGGGPSPEGAPEVMASDGAEAPVPVQSGTRAAQAATPLLPSRSKSKRSDASSGGLIAQQTNGAMKHPRRGSRFSTRAFTFKKNDDIMTALAVPKG
ncbi:hypothetical protein ACSSS7_003734 [Eimeria intestinalis]